MAKKISVKMLLSPDIGDIKGPGVAGTERMFLKDKAVFESAFETRAFARFSYQGVEKIFFLRFFLVLSMFFQKRRGRISVWASKIFLFIAELIYALVFLLKTHSSDLILSYCFPLVGLLVPTRTVVFLHFVPNFYLSKLLLNRYRRLRYVACSEFLKKQIVHKYPYLKLEITVLYNSVDTKIFRPVKQKTHPKIRLLFASAWVAEKGLLVLLQAFKNLPPKIQAAFHLTISGSPNLWFLEFSESNTPYLNKITSISRTLKNIEFVGEVNHKEVSQLYNSHDYVVFPSSWGESFGLVVLESLACGTPVISSTKGALLEIISPSNSFTLKKVTAAEVKRVLIQVYHLKKKGQLKKSGKSLFTEKNEVMKDSVRDKILKDFLVSAS